MAYMPPPSLLVDEYVGSGWCVLGAHCEENRPRPVISFRVVFIPGDFFLPSFQFCGAPADMSSATQQWFGGGGGVEGKMQGLRGPNRGEGTVGLRFDD